MSDSELSDAPSNESPPDSQIEETLRKEVSRAAKGPLEEYTVSRIRKAAEKALELPEGFFKGDERWKARSKAIIDNQVEIESAATSAPEPKVKPEQANKSEAKPKKPVKRPSPVESKRPQKKQKIDFDEETSALSTPPDDDESDFDSKERKQKATKGRKKSEVAKPKHGPKAGASGVKKKSKPDVEDDDSDNAEDKDVGSGSEMSVVLDEAPAPKRSKSKSKSTDTAGKKAKPNATKPKSSTEADPDQEEIKKLQGWLGKCGVRKVWGKELKPFETSKAKMKYLRDMLAEIGMTGRYSNEKAAQIKEARELAADIEAVQEGNERWGKSDEEDGDRDAKVRGARRLVRGAKNYDFLSSDGEETD